MSPSFHFSSMRLLATSVACVIVLAIVLYSLYWYAMSNIIIKSEVIDWVSKTNKTSDFNIGYNDIDVSGYPLSIDMIFNKPRVLYPDNFNLTAPTLILSVAPLNLNHVTADFPTGGTIESTVENPHQYAIHFDRLIGDMHQYAERTINKTTISLTAETIAGAVSSPMTNNEIASLSIQTTNLNLLSDPYFPLTPNYPSIQQWQKMGGKITISNTGIVFNDTLSAHYNGTLTLNDSLQPALTGQLRTSGIENNIQNLINNPAIDPNTGILINNIFNTVRDNYGDDNGDIVIPLIIQNQFLMVGPLPIMAMPFIEWDDQ